MAPPPHPSMDKPRPNMMPRQVKPPAQAPRNVLDRIKRTSNLRAAFLREDNDDMSEPLLSLAETSWFDDTVSEPDESSDHFQSFTFIDSKSANTKPKPKWTFKMKAEAAGIATPDFIASPRAAISRHTIGLTLPLNPNFPTSTHNAPAATQRTRSSSLSPSTSTPPTFTPTHPSSSHPPRQCTCDSCLMPPTPKFFATPPPSPSPPDDFDIAAYLASNPTGLHDNGFRAMQRYVAHCYDSEHHAEWDRSNEQQAGRRRLVKRVSKEGQRAGRSAGASMHVRRKTWSGALGLHCL
ncbi:hypothetical protein IQ07DRAFT_653566 [Pyrenochaeta sp. DS3sAY3a]|nr:hypothetical protein IQ07DRAFT_653566 [Pyrenochaeta sp. DS3sAY3a]